MAVPSAATIDWNDVQGLVNWGYGKHPCAANLLLEVKDASSARAWLASVCERITTVEGATKRREGCYLNLAFTRAGLSMLGLTEGILASFPTAFYDGAASDNRARILGDEGDSAPDQWRWGKSPNEVHAILMIFAKDAAALALAVTTEQAAFKGVTLKMGIETLLAEDRREHFGFHDGISQPVIRGSPFSKSPGSRSPYDPSNLIEAGEFLLGYPNEYGVLPDAPDLPAGADPRGILPTVKSPLGVEAPDLGRNGTFLVVRQLEQHVPRLWNYLQVATQNADGQSRPADCEQLAAKLIGRWPSGAPLALAGKADNADLADFNDFVYGKDNESRFRCPFGAHVRRGNPRDTLGGDAAEALKLTKRHRLMRRGRSYGCRISNPFDSSDTQERGLLFMCVNANIERQFEFVQQTWINNPSFNGLYGERDPIFGSSSSTTEGSMTIPDLPVRQRLSGLGGFVTVKGGAYFFLPGMSALRYLAASVG